METSWTEVAWWAVVVVGFLAWRFITAWEQVQTERANSARCDCMCCEVREEVNSVETRQE
jgi:hypothetical protein